ncbi:MULTISPECIES: hypothetical protein [unclassified Sutcliffiella]|uniref:hypothetical protein n=1 Tax=unclassified Sutcliffiella TaxID=2837532 RepID=UPI0030D5ED90
MVDSVLTLKFLISLVVFGALFAGAVRLMLRRNRFGPLLVALVVFVGGYFLYDQIRSTTSDAVVFDKVREDSVIRHLKIRKVELERSTYTFKESILIEEEATIREIMKDLSGLELKREFDKEPGGADYVLDLLISNSKDNLMKTGTLQITVGNEYINDYKIVNEKDHLKTIKELEEREDLVWEKE